jgi:DHA1 family multidrug resistance protein-like MFS transporter
MPGSASSWRSIVLVFWITSMIEGLGVSQVFALLPAQLTSMGVPDTERLSFIGIFSSLLFVLGMPLVPLWGVWADKYSRKAVIARSAVVEAVVFAGMALAREPWQVALSLLLIGFQLGNTGVMLAGIRDATPTKRLGTTIAVFGAAGPVGFALGPTIAGILIDGAGWSISGVFGLSAALSIGTAVLVFFGSREIRPAIIPEGRVLTLAFGAIRGVLGDPHVRGIFLIFGTAFLANQMARPYLPVLVETIVGRGAGLASAIALVAGTAALAGALISPLGGALGDRIGFKPVLIGALIGGSISLGLMPLSGSIGGVPVLALDAVAFALCTSGVSAMVFGLLATEVPPERRSATLNLGYLPLYAAPVLQGVGLTPDLFPATFALARHAGWTAHIIEQAAANRIIRPADRYIGPPERDLPA